MDWGTLKEYGIDADQGLARCMNDPAFYQMLLSMFLKDGAFARAKAAWEADDRKALFASVHELKGVSGTAALVELYQASAPFVKLLRDGAAAQADVDRLFAAVETAYLRTCEGISRAIDP